MINLKVEKLKTPPPVITALCVCVFEGSEIACTSLVKGEEKHQLSKKGRERERKREAKMDGE